ncbi:energy transducer TonB [Salinimicrobium soli]|uniref:energy transducer TonB n=1 Tax=Salinimicrobium soli TaxID=1254399 RepID=UPI003AB0A6E4
MKKLLIVFLLLAGGICTAQEGVKVKGNTLTTKQTAPVWPGCEGTAAEKKNCFNKKLVEHMKANYKFPKDASGNYIRGKAVVSFNINEEGKVEVLSVEGPKKELNAEAKRIILAIPPMEPGMLAGKPTAVKYKVPFTF